MDRKVGVTTTQAHFNEIMEEYLIETEAGWYAVSVPGLEPQLVKNIAGIVQSDKIEPYIKLFIREESELDLIERDSYVYKLYSSKYGNRKFRDVDIDIHTLG